MRAEGRAVDDELLAHISPAHSENVNFFGTINVEVDTELAKLDPAGYRPLRSRRPDRPWGASAFVAATLNGIQHRSVLWHRLWPRARTGTTLLPGLTALCSSVPRLVSAVLGCCR
ncbi:hypothetical protein GCM10010424_69030 [Streptomyces lienomycini]